ncbi:MAG: ThuA domain-containing protein, partial [Oscillospiraceae bacterium]
MKIKVTVWNEFRHEREKDDVKAVYPDGIHMAIANFLNEEDDIEVKCAYLDQPENGLTEEVLADTDVLIWWGHAAHDEVSDAVVDRVQNHVLCGMGFIPLHSSHFSKPFKRLMGTSCSLKWREIGEKERVWVVEPTHPIAKGLGEYFELPHEEMYGERFDIPTPDALVFMSWFQGGEVFRSGCCYNRGLGKVFYFQPGHETYPTYYDKNVQNIIKNAVRWAKPVLRIEKTEAPNHKPLEKFEIA